MGQCTEGTGACIPAVPSPTGGRIFSGPLLLPENRHHLFLQLPPWLLPRQWNPPPHLTGKNRLDIQQNILCRYPKHLSGDLARAFRRGTISLIQSLYPKLCLAPKPHAVDIPIYPPAQYSSGIPLFSRRGRARRCVHRLLREFDFLFLVHLFLLQTILALCLMYVCK